MKKIKLDEDPQLNEDLFLIPIHIEQENCTMSTAVNQVFNTPEILEKICNLLDLKTLKECRQVSKLWRTEGAKPILKKYFIKFPNWFKLGNRPPYYRSEYNLPWEQLRKQHHKAAIHEFVSLSHPSILINLVIPTSEDVELFLDYDFNFLLSKVKKLKYETSCRDNMENLCKLLQKMPNLKILLTSCLDLSPDQRWLQNIKDKEIFLSKLESLQEIKTSFDPTTSAFTSWLKFRDSLKGIKKFNNPEHQMMTTLLNSGQQWPIQKLTLSVDIKNFPPKLLKQFFSSIADTLQSLSIRFMSGLDPSDREWEEMCHEPLELLYNLKKLKLSCFSRHPPHHLSMRRRCLNVALKLPLKSLDLCLDGYNVPSDLDHQVPFCIDKSSLSLEKLTFHMTGREGHQICHCESLNQIYYPNLRVLQLKLELFHNLTPTVMKTIFKNMKNIKRLVLRIAEDICKGIINQNSPIDAERQRPGRWARLADDSKVNWDEILTGIQRQRPLTGLEEEYEAEIEEGPSIKNLHDLTSLQIVNVSSCPISDYFIYNGLVHLKKLQSLVIQGHLFTPKAINRLKDCLSNRTFINVDENPPYRKCNYSTPSGGIGESTSRLFL